MLTLAGIDASLSNTGVCIIDNGKLSFYSCKAPKIPQQPSDAEKHARLACLVDEIYRILLHHDVRVVAIENYAFSKVSSSVTPLAELQGALKYVLCKQNISCVSLTVATVRKFCVGKFIQKKSLFHEALKSAQIISMYPCTHQEPSNEDEIDAFAVAHTLYQGWQLCGSEVINELVGFALSVSK